MKKVPVIFIFFFILLLKPQAAFAATDQAFVFHTDTQEFPVTKAEVNSWQSTQIVERENIFNPSPEPARNSLLKFIGQPTTSVIPAPTYNYSLSAVYNYIQQNLSPKITLPAVMPVLKIESDKAVEFTPPRAGAELDVYKSTFDALAALQTNTPSVELIVIKEEVNSSLAETNSLGINELIAEGVSNFKGSPNNRRHNIKVGVEKFKGVIIPQGAEFSFNDNLGPVEKENGFLPELVIKATGTVPELGGGLCQVSSTTFRAAMQAGLPITQRRNHAYAVQYYSPQGTDATIYPGVIDLKFINDTPGAILIWPHFEEKDILIFDFYGTKDTRQVTLDTPVAYDRQTSGAMKATWTRKVIAADGKERTDVFKSVYASPALYHKTEEFVTAGQPGVPVGAPPPVLAPPI